MAENFQNFYVTKLREACDAVATTIYVDTVPAITEGTLVIEYANSTKHEIIHFTGVSGYGLTGCTRGLEGTTAQSHSAGVDVRQNLTAGMIDKIINGVITTENIADGAVTADKIDFTTLSGNYSTTEVDTGFTWVDGKHIYKKTIYFGNCPNTAEKRVSTGITGIDKLIRLECMAYNSTAVWYFSPSGVTFFPNDLSSVGGGSFSLSYAKSSNELVMITGMDRRSAVAYATMYYTKTS